MRRHWNDDDRIGNTVCDSPVAVSKACENDRLCAAGGHLKRPCNQSRIQLLTVPHDSGGPL